MKKYKQLNDGSIEIEPINQHKYTLIWMHGLGDTSFGFLDVFAQQQLTIVKEQTKILLLQAPIRKVTINMGMQCTSWFDIKIFKENLDITQFQNTISLDEVQDSKTKILKYLNEEVEKVGSNNIFIGGFSQGCSMALEVGLSYPKTLGGIIGLSGYLFPTTQINDAQQSTPLYLIHGTQDQLIACELSQQSYQRINNQNRPQFNIIINPQMGHEVPLKVIQQLQQIFKNIQQ